MRESRKTKKETRQRRQYQHAMLSCQSILPVLCVVATSLKVAWGEVFVFLSGWFCPTPWLFFAGVAGGEGMEEEAPSARRGMVGK